MESFFTYLWKPAIIIAIFYGFYRLFLQKETYFQSIRYFLLSGIVLAIVLPFIIIPIYADISSIQLTQLTTNNLAASSSLVSESSINWMAVTFYSYLVATTIFLLRFISQLASIMMLILKNNRIKVDNYYFVEVDSDTSPFSFFNFIIYNPSQFTQTELDQILAHEKVHVHQHHSFDTLISNILISIQWFNPFAWLYKKEMGQNLEFIADEFAQKVSSSQQSYQQLLLKTSVPQFQMALANNFYNSLLKKRIIMLQSKKSNSRSQWKIALILPFLLVFVFTFNTKTIAQHKKVKKEFIEKNVEIIELLISKESSQDDLKKITKTFADKGLSVKFNGVKRNSNNEITAIKIDAKASNGKASASYASDNDEGINPIQISFDNDNNNLSIGSNDRNLGKAHVFSNKIHKFIKNNGQDHVFTIHEDDNDGTTKVWITKDGDTAKAIIKKMVIDIDKDHDSDEEHEIHIEMDTDGKEVKKEVYKIRSKKGDVKESKKEKIIVISDSENENPLIILNGKEISKEEMEDLDPDSIKMIDVLKGDKATEKHGDKGKNGVIIITTKK